MFQKSFVRSYEPRRSPGEWGPVRSDPELPPAENELDPSLRTDRNQSNSCCQRQCSEDRRKRNFLLLVYGCVNRTHVEDFFPMRVGESLIDKCESAQNNQQDSCHRDRLHVCNSSVKRRSFAPGRRGSTEQSPRVSTECE